MIFSPAAVSKVRTLRTSLARDPFPGPSSTSCSCLGWPAPIHSLRIHTPTSWNKPETCSQHERLTVYSVSRKTNHWEFDLSLQLIESVLNQRILVCFNHFFFISINCLGSFYSWWSKEIDLVLWLESFNKFFFSKFFKNRKLTFKLTFSRLSMYFWNISIDGDLSYTQ